MSEKRIDSGPGARAEHTFRLAPMSPGIAALTYSLFLLPVTFAWFGHLLPLLYGVAAFVVSIYASVWLWMRPTRFVVSPAGLRILWPLRFTHTLAADIVDVRRISGEEFRRQYGLGMRVGAGGLWGGFGLLITAKETLVMYVSRVDDLVLVRRASERPLLITPEDPERFVRELHGR